jgi:hypothetical protein
MPEQPCACASGTNGKLEKTRTSTTYKFAQIKGRPIKMYEE